MLLHKRITLLSPEKWEDLNDAYYMERYKEVKKLKTLLATCFTTRHETFHHWKIFSGAGGGCVQFNSGLVRAVQTHKLQGSSRILMRKAKYRLIRKVVSEKPKPPDWPFLKRIPFKDEGEFRIVFQSSSESLRSYSIPLPLSAIENIRINPWMPEALAESLIEVIRSLPGCAGLDVARSTLLENKMWRDAISASSSATANPV